MSIRKYLKASLLIFSIFVLSTKMVIAATLTTTFAGGNGQDGNMFDINAISAVTITGFDSNLNAGLANVEIYGKTGTHVGSENIAGDWTLLGSATVTSLGAGVGTPLPITLNVPIAAGSSYAFYVTTIAAAPDVNYTNGVAVGAVAADDGVIQILEGTGKGYPFDPTNTYAPRVWNGTVTYTAGIVAPTGPTAVPTLSEWALIFLILSLSLVGLNISHRKSI